MCLVVQRTHSVVVKHGLGGGAFMRPWAPGRLSEVLDAVMHVVSTRTCGAPCN